MLNASEWQNARQPLDTNLDATISATDAAVVIDALLAQRSLAQAGRQGHLLDVNGDRHLTPLDALIILNHLTIAAASRVETDALMPAPATSSPGSWLDASAYLMSKKQGGQIFLGGRLSVPTSAGAQLRLQFFERGPRGDRWLDAATVETSGDAPTQLALVIEGSVDAGRQLLVKADGRSFTATVLLPVNQGTQGARGHGADFADEIEDFAPRGGDANQDAIPDRHQEDVASLPSATNKGFVTFDARGRKLRNVKVVKPPPGLEKRLPYGEFAFELRGVPIGGIAEVRMLLPEGAASTVYRKTTAGFDDSPWFGFDGSTGAVFDGNLVRLYLQDGGRGDADGVANGVIVDPSGPYDLACDPPQIDPYGNLMSCIAPNHPPQVSPINGSEVFVGQSNVLSLAATDPDGDALSYHVSGFPGAAVDNSGLFTWTPVSAGVYTGTLTVTDDGLPNLSASATFNLWAVCDPEDPNATGSLECHAGDPSGTNQPPLVGSNAGWEAVVGEPTAAVFSASDPDGDSLTFSVSGFPGAAIDSSGLFTWTPTAVGVHTGTLTVTDDGTPHLSASRTFNIWVYCDPEDPSTTGWFQCGYASANHAPVLGELGDLTVDVGDVLHVLASATDVDGDSLTYSLSGLPGATIDANGSISWTAAAVAAYQVAVTVADEGSPSLSDTATFSVTVVQEGGGGGSSGACGSAHSSDARVVGEEGIPLENLRLLTLGLGGDPISFHCTRELFGATFDLDWEEPWGLGHGDDLQMQGTFVPRQSHGGVPTALYYDGSVYTDSAGRTYSQFAAASELMSQRRTGGYGWYSDGDGRFVRQIYLQWLNGDQVFSRWFVEFLDLQHFSVQIDWGDGVISSGTLSFTPGSPPGASSPDPLSTLTVSGSHTFSVGGEYHPLVTISNEHYGDTSSGPYADSGPYAPHVHEQLVHPDVALEREYSFEAAIAPRVFVEGTQVSESASAALFRIVLSAPNPFEESISVDVTTLPSTAMPGEDYAHTAATILFDAGEDEAWWSVPIIDDGVSEPPEEFRVALSNPWNAVLCSSCPFATGVILDDDAVGLVNVAVNIPPDFTSRPIVEAYVGQPYSYFVSAADADGDPVVLSLLSSDERVELLASGSGMGTVRWTPPSDLAHRKVSVVLEATDGTDTTQQAFEILVLPTPGNRNPIILSTPQTSHEIAGEWGQAAGAVSPSSIDWNLEPGETRVETIQAIVAKQSPTFLEPQGPANRLTVIPETSASRLVDVLLGGGAPGLIVTGLGLKNNTDQAPIIAEIPTQHVALGAVINIPISVLDPEDEALTLHVAGDFSRVVAYLSGAETITVSAAGPQAEAGHYIYTLTAKDKADYGVQQESSRSFLVKVGIPPGDPTVDPDLPAPFSSPPIASTGVFVNNNGALDMGDYGIVLSTGNVADYGTSDNIYVDNTTIWDGTASEHPLLQPITSSSSFDVTELTIAFDLEEGFDTVSFDLVFGSEEFKEFVNTQFNDGFGLYIDGENIAFADDSTGNGMPININHPEVRHQNGCRLFPNVGDECDPAGPGPARLDGTELDGILAPAGNPVLHFSKYLGNGSSDHELTFVIGDSGDPEYDTTVYIEKLSAWSEAPRELDLVATSPDAPFRNRSGRAWGMPGDQVEFTAEFEGTGLGHLFELAVLDVASGQFLGSLPVSLNGSYWYLVKAQDPDDDALLYRLQESPSGAAIDAATGQLNWLPPGPGDYSFVVVVEDGRGGSARQDFVVSVQVPPANHPPVLEPIADQNAVVGWELSHAVGAHDEDCDHLVFFLVEGPPEMHIEPRAGVITWTPESSLLNQSREVTVRVVDGHGGWDEESFVVTVVPNPHNQAPAFVSDPITEHAIAPLQDAIGSVWPRSLQFDLLPGQVVTEEVRVDLINQDVAVDLPEGLPDAMVVINETDPLVLQKMLMLGGGAGIDVTAVNLYSHSESSPMLDPVPDQQVEVGGTLTLQLAAVDDDPVTYMIDGPSRDKGFALNAQTGEITWTPPPAFNHSSHYVVVAARDPQWLVVSQKFKVTVGQDDRPPPPIPPQYPLLPPRSVSSAGVFVNRHDTYDLGRYGIVLSTGNAAAYGSGPSKSERTSLAYGAPALPEQEDLLEVLAEGGISHFDVTQFDLTFDLSPGIDTINFDVVFGSEEFGELLHAHRIDAFGILVNGQNVALAEAVFLDANNQPLSPYLHWNRWVISRLSSFLTEGWRRICVCICRQIVVARG